MLFRIVSDRKQLLDVYVVVEIVVEVAGEVLKTTLVRGAQAVSGECKNTVSIPDISEVTFIEKLISPPELVEPGCSSSANEFVLLLKTLALTELFAGNPEQEIFT